MANELGRTLLAAHLGADGAPSQRQLARELGCTQAAVSDWINDKAVPSAKFRARLKARFGIPLPAWDTPEETEALETLRAKAS